MTPEHHRVRTELHRPIRPRLVRIVARCLQIAVVLGAVGIIVFTGRVPGVEHWGLVDQAGTAILGLIIIAALERWARIAAVPDEDGLTVRNFLGGRRVSWAEIIGVEYGQHRPWAVLDLADSTTLSVIAVQRADGARAADAASRLSTLVELHSRETGTSSPGD